MRKKQYLVSPKVNIKEVKVSDFSKITDYATNLKISDKICSSDITLRYISVLKGTMLKTYRLGERFFAYMKDKCIYELKDKEIQLVLSDRTQPLMIDVVIDGKKEVLVIESNSAYILNKNITFNFPFGQAIAKLNGRLFVANEKSLYFSNQFNFTEYSTDIENQGFISVDDFAGQILDLIEYKDSLMVVCKNAIYKLSIIDQDFEFNSLDLNYIDILPNSIKKVGDKIYFISENKLLEFNGSSITRLSKDFDRFLSTAKESATATQSLYSISLSLNGKDAILVYDTITGEHHYIRAYGVLNLGENGHVFVKDIGTIYKITTHKDYQTYEWVSKSIDFESLDKKALLELRISVNQPIALFITGDFGEKEIQLVEGVNIKKLNLTSRAFKMRFSYYANTLTAQNFSLKYKFVGE